MKKMLMGAMALAMVSGVAFAADSMTGVYGNTLVITHTDGTSAKIKYKQDHTYSATDNKGVTTTGTWAAADGKICVTQTSPAPAAGMEKRCGADFTGKKAGDSWEMTADDGAKTKLGITAGQ